MDGNCKMTTVDEEGEERESLKDMDSDTVRCAASQRIGFDVVPL